MDYLVHTRFGIMNLEKKRPSEAAYFGFWFMAIFWSGIGIASLIGGLVVQESILLFIGLVFSGMGAFFLLTAKQYASMWWKLKREYETQKDKEQKIFFYNECLKRGIRHMKSPAYRQKAKLIAQQMGLSIEDPVAYFEAAYQEMETEELQALARSEYEAFNALSRYAQYIGYDKKAAMLRDMIAVKNGEIEELMSPVLDSERARKREADWAIHGGIASGLAGPVAGLAAAVHVSQRNAEIRANNAELTRLQMQYMSVVAGDISRLKRQIEDLEQQISEHQTKVMNETASQEIMHKLTVTLQEIKVSQTGAFVVKASVQCNSPVLVCGELPGVVDGTIAADVYQGKQQVGTAWLTFPVDGIEQKAVTVEGIGLGEADPAKDCKVKFRAYHLWEIEK